MKLIAALLAAAALVAPVRAEEKAAAKPGFTFSGFFKNLKASVEASAVAGQRKKGRHVAAVRGEDQTTELANPDMPTLKGDSKSKLAAKKAAEDAELYKATLLVEQNKHAEALAAFQAFQKAHPKSRRDEVEQAIAELKKVAGEGEAAAAPVDEKKAE